MREYFVLDYGRVLVNEDVFNGEGGDLGEENAAEGVGYGGVDADEGEGGVVGCVGVELDAKTLMKSVRCGVGCEGDTRSYISEVIQVPFMVFARPVSWEVCGCLVAHGFDANYKLLYMR